MFNQIFGLPAHPLITHAAVVVTPLLVALAIAYVALPRLRHKLDWAVVLSAIAAPLSVIAAARSGEEFEDLLFPGEAPSSVEAHENFAEPLGPLTGLLALAALALVVLTRSRRTSDATRPVRITTVLVSVATVVLALAAGYFVVRTGHSGATAVWTGGR